MQDRGLLWRVQDGERTSWLYGTLHVGKRGILPGRTILRAMVATDLLALELDVLNPQVMQQLIEGFQARVDALALPAELEARLAQQRKQACAEHLSTQRPTPSCGAGQPTRPQVWADGRGLAPIWVTGQAWPVPCTSLC